MRAKLSVVIPALNAAGDLPACLAALIEGLETGLIRELIVSDGGSRDATPEIAATAGAELVAGEPSRGGQLRRGAEAAAGDWLLFLHADTVLPPGWVAVTRAQMTRARPAYFRLRFADGGWRGRLVAGWANLRSRALALPYGDQGLLISRRDYDAVGGFRDIPLMEDVAIVRALGRRLQALPAAVTTSAERYVRDGWFRRGGRNLWLLIRYLAGADPEKLARRY